MLFKIFVYRLRVNLDCYTFLGTGHKVQGVGPAEIGGGSSIFKLMKKGVCHLNIGPVYRAKLKLGILLKLH